MPPAAFVLTLWLVVASPTAPPEPLVRFSFASRELCEAVRQSSMELVRRLRVFSVPVGGCEAVAGAAEPSPISPPSVAPTGGPAPAPKEGTP